MHIIATIGPKSLNKLVLKDFLYSGVDIIRLNCSHFREEEFDNIVKESRKIKKDIHIMIDLCGKKIRVSENFDYIYKVFSKDVVYFCGEDFYESIKVDKLKDMKIIPLNIKSDILKCSDISSVSMKDNTMSFKVLEKKQGLLKAEVKEGGIIRKGKGCNIVELCNNQSYLNGNDKNCINWAVKNNIDIICQSYVESSKEIDEVIKFITPEVVEMKNIDVWAKVETPKGMDNLNEIIQKVDYIVIGRGDLVPEAGLLNAVELENMAIRYLRDNNKKVILATHILNSMKSGRKPELPEIESIYSFINSGVNGFLLAGETSVGRAPVKTVKYLSDVISQYMR